MNTNGKPDKAVVALEDAFCDALTLTFAQLQHAEENLTAARLSVQRLYSIHDSLSKLRHGRRNVGVQRKMVKGLLGW